MDDLHKEIKDWIAEDAKKHPGGKTTSISKEIRQFIIDRGYSRRQELDLTEVLNFLDTFLPTETLVLTEATNITLHKWNLAKAICAKFRAPDPKQGLSTGKKVISFEFHHNCCNGGYKSQEQLLKENALVGSIYLADDISKAWGDDWNDAPACCNAGSVYKDTVTGLIEIPVYLGKTLDIPLNTALPTGDVGELVEAFKKLLKEYRDLCHSEFDTHRRQWENDSVATEADQAISKFERGEKP